MEKMYFTSTNNSLAMNKRPDFPPFQGVVQDSRPVFRQAQDERARILVVGKFSTNPNVYTYATSFCTTFKQLGFDTAFVDCTPKGPLQHTPVVNKIIRPLAVHIANAAIIHAVKKHNASLVFIIKGQHISPQTIQTIKGTGARVVNFYPDNPFALWNDNSTEAILKSLPLFDCFLSWSPILTPALLASGSPHVCAFPFAYDENIYNDQQSPLFPGQKRSKSGSIDVCFIGTWEAERETLLEQAIIRLPNISFGIWGNNWQQHAQSPHIKKCLMGNAIYEQTMVGIYKNAKIVLNFLRAQNSNAHNMRTFEVPATKSFLLTERTQQQAQLFFQEDYSIACFTGIDELVEKINTYLYDTQARALMSERSFVAAQHYTLHKQLRHFIDSCPALR